MAQFSPESWLNSNRNGGSRRSDRWLKIARNIHGSFQERDKVPGNRSGMLYLMSLGSSELQLETEAWDRDPYDSNREKGFLMNWAEDEKYDGLFPYHPLSEMRRFINYVVENN